MANAEDASVPVEGTREGPSIHEGSSQVNAALAKESTPESSPLDTSLPDSAARSVLGDESLEHPLLDVGVLMHQEILQD
jgi:hypothetical protein